MTDGTQCDQFSTGPKGLHSHGWEVTEKEVGYTAGIHITMLLAKPLLTASSSLVTEHKGPLNLLCETSDTMVTIHWLFHDRPLMLGSHMNLSADNKSLTLITVLRTDFGPYQCEARSGGQSEKSNLCNIAVNYGPDPFTITVDMRKANQKVQEIPRGAHVTFSVLIQSYPIPNYTWTVPNSVEQPRNTNTFSISRMTKEHSGTYKCVVTNLATQQTQMDTLEIQVLEQLTPLSITVSSDFLMESETRPPVNLICRTNHTGVSVRWLLQGQPLQPSGRLVLSADNCTLAIFRLQRTDTGPYQCLVWGSIGEARSEPVLLNIYYGPDKLNISSSTQNMPGPIFEAALGSYLILNCQADAHPSPQYRWTSRNRTFNTNRLIFVALSWEDEGVHTCTASNPQTGKSSSTLVVLRLWDPSLALSAGAIAGIVLGVVAAIAIALGLLYFFYFRRGPTYLSSRFLFIVD
ncbi:carcinoembryonic antigen-related cell adhesion molecule 20 [Sorex fumeus]|uniref:carcinoembryonic antigen-related cell adhesion molecule 20 n=1 Tax=Sorex fumeus TaxID=62283 RepID=UPI0024AE1986|nr:carcinoembryonic antigen-related cell adhesion molecule 20 [Sorex fumeus]